MPAGEDNKKSEKETQPQFRVIIPRLYFKNPDFYAGFVVPDIGY